MSRAIFQCQFMVHMAMPVSRAAFHFKCKKKYPCEIQKSHKIVGQRENQIKRKNSETNLGKQAALRFKRNLNLMPLIIEKLFQSEECHSTERTVIPPVHTNFKLPRL